MDNQTFATAIVTEIAEDGLKLKFPGEETGGEKVYPCNAGCSFAVGDRVVVYPDSGTFIVMFPLGAPGSRFTLPSGGGDGYVLTRGIVAQYSWKANMPTQMAGNVIHVRDGGFLPSDVYVGDGDDRIGFFGKAPVERENLPANATAAQLSSALHNLGLIGYPA